MKHPEDGTVVVREFSTRSEANVVVGLLQAEGIEARVYSDDTGAEIPALSLVRGVGVCVAEADEARARKVLAEVDAQEGADDESGRRE